MDVHQIQAMAYATSKEHGFHDDWVFGEKIALIHSEASEALEAFRDLTDSEPISQTWYAENGKPEGIPSELADIVIRVADLAGLCQINLNSAIEEKLAYNLTRPFKHNKRV